MEKQSNTWLQHVAAFKAKNPSMTYKECLQEAGKPEHGYIRVPVVERDPNAPKKANSWMEHVARFKALNPEWRARMSYKEVLLHCATFYRKPDLKDSDFELPL